MNRFDKFRLAIAANFGGGFFYRPFPDLGDPLAQPNRNLSYSPSAGWAASGEAGQDGNFDWTDGSGLTLSILGYNNRQGPWIYHYAQSFQLPDNDRLPGTVLFKSGDYRVVLDDLTSESVFQQRQIWRNGSVIATAPETVFGCAAVVAPSGIKWLIAATGAVLTWKRTVPDWDYVNTEPTDAGDDMGAQLYTHEHVIYARPLSGTDDDWIEIGRYDYGDGASTTVFEDFDAGRWGTAVGSLRAAAYFESFLRYYTPERNLAPWYFSASGTKATTFVSINTTGFDGDFHEAIEADEDLAYPYDSRRADLSITFESDIPVATITVIDGGLSPLTSSFSTTASLSDLRDNYLYNDAGDITLTYSAYFDGSSTYNSTSSQDSLLAFDYIDEVPAGLRYRVDTTRADSTVVTSSGHRQTYTYHPNDEIKTEVWIADFSLTDTRRQTTRHRLQIVNEDTSEVILTLLDVTAPVDVDIVHNTAPGGAEPAPAGSQEIRQQNFSLFYPMDLDIRRLSFVIAGFVAQGSSISGSSLNQHLFFYGDGAWRPAYLLQQFWTNPDEVLGPELAPENGGQDPGWLVSQFGFAWIEPNITHRFHINEGHEETSAGSGLVFVSNAASNDPTTDYEPAMSDSESYSNGMYTFALNPAGSQIKLIARDDEILVYRHPWPSTTKFNYKLFTLARGRDQDSFDLLPLNDGGFSNVTIGKQ